MGYERYGMQADIAYLQERMNRENYHFDVIELKGSLSKNDRIRRLIPIFETGNWYLPQTLYRTVYDGKTLDLIDVFLNQEYDNFPVSTHDDMLDVKARILDESMNAVWPYLYEDPSSRDAYQGVSNQNYSQWGV